MHHENKINLSIIIPVVNEEQFLNKLFLDLKKYFNQDDVEVIIVNDGSNDSSYKILQQLKKNFYRVVGSNPKEDLNEFKFDINYSKKNLMYYKLKDISALVNDDDSVTDISYKVDLSRKKNVDELSKDKFTSYLHFPS